MDTIKTYKKGQGVKRPNKSSDIEPIFSNGNKPLQIALIYGGLSAEREVSLKGAKAVKAALLELGCTVRDYDIKFDLKKIIEDADQIDCAFIALHGEYGEDGRIQGLLDMLGIPYQGAGVLGSSLAMDKHIAKTIYSANNIPTPKWITLNRSEVRGISQQNIREIMAENKFSLPVVIKPKGQGSSIGINIVKGIDAGNNKNDEIWDEETLNMIKNGLYEAIKWDEAIIIEEYIEGRELSVGVVEGISPQTLPPIEIRPDEQFNFFDYKAKYTPGATAEICPADIDPHVEDRARALALNAHNALCLKDYSRTDMILDRSSNLWVIETNTIPGMTETSLLPQEARAVGIEFKGLIRHLITMALKK